MQKTPIYILPAGSSPTPEAIKKAIDYNIEWSKRYKKLAKYYACEHPILKRRKDDGLSNHKVVINHAKYIVDMKVGYMLGNAAEYQVAQEKGKVYDIDAILLAMKSQFISLVNHEIAEESGIYGRSYEYIYVAEGTNELRFDPVNPCNCIIAYDDSVEHKKLFAVMYDDCDSKGEYKNVVVVDSEKIKYFKDGKELMLGEEYEHNFEVVPVIEYANNKKRRSDYEDVLTPMDAYNLLQSDRVNDKEQFVEAYLVLKGMTITPDQLDEARATRTLAIPATATMEYLTKNIDEANVDVLRQVLEQDIHKIAMVPNFTDKEFIGNASGVAIRYKLLAFEQNVSNKEMFMEKGLIERFEIVNTYLTKLKSIEKVPLHLVDVVFKHNLPQNDLETSQIINNLDGIVSRATLMSQLSFVKNAEEEMKAVETENQNAGNIEDPNFGTETPSNTKPEIAKPSDNANA
jgi:SPP1 family phage portal protein